MLPPPVENGFREWQSIEFPQWLRELGFEDTSYHNDLCARATRPLEGYGRQVQAGTEDFNDFPCIVAWCEHEKVEDREDPSLPHYDVYIQTGEYDDGMNRVAVYSGEDAAACKAAILALHGRVVGASDEGACLGSIVRLGQKHIVVVFDQEDWRNYEDSENGGVLYRLTGENDEWTSADGSSVVTLIDLMEVKK